MYLVNLDLNFPSFPSHITTLYRGGGEIAYRDKKHSVPRVLAAIVGVIGQTRSLIHWLTLGFQDTCRLDSMYLAITVEPYLMLSFILWLVFYTQHSYVI